MSERGRRLTEQADQARRDLTELGAQVEAGEIDEDAARPLRASYLRELESATAELAGLSDVEAPQRGVVEGRPPTHLPTPGRSGNRLLIGAGILVAAVALTIGLVGSFAQERQTDILEGVAAAPGEAVDLDSVSNETLEAVIESYRDDPAVAEQLPLMEFRLAERYFEERDYLASFPHYSSVIQNPNTPADRVQVSLTRVGWLVWVLNDETDLAISTIDEALSLDPSNPETLYVKGQILWCGLDRPDEALPLFEEVLASDDLPPDVATQVRADIDLAAAGERCTP